MAPTIGYWNFRGVGQPIRLMLEYVGQPFEEKRYDVGADGDMVNWLKEKFTLGLDMPNLPFYIDGDLKLTQSVAIMNYIGREHNLCADTNRNKAYVDMLVQQVMDIRNKYYEVVFDEAYPAKEADYLKDLPKQLKIFSDFLGTNDWFVNNKISVADFPIYEFLYVHMRYAPDSVKAFPNLPLFVSRFEALPAIQKYMKSPKYLKVCNGLWSKWDSSE